MLSIGNDTERKHLHPLLAPCKSVWRNRTVDSSRDFVAFPNPERPTPWHRHETQKDSRVRSGTHFSRRSAGKSSARSTPVLLIVADPDMVSRGAGCVRCRASRATQ